MSVLLPMFLAISRTISTRIFLETAVLRLVKCLLLNSWWVIAKSKVIFWNTATMIPFRRFFFPLFEWGLACTQKFLCRLQTKKKFLEASSRVQDLGAVYSFPLPMTGIRYIAAKRERSSQFQALKYTPISIHV